jgi:DNA topoisomerase-3
MGLFTKIKNKFNRTKMVVIAEKYSAAEAYANALQCSKNDPSYFENDKYIIAWTDGHLCTLYDPEDYDSKYKKWDLNDLPILPNGFWIKVRKGKKKKVDIIKTLIEREDVNGVCIGTDSAREGNLIGEYVLMAIGNKKPVYRVMISALNNKEIIAGFNNMKTADTFENLTLAAQARDEIDWSLGINLSRLYSLLSNNQYYIGRCKTVLLSLLCDRENEINNFKASISYSIHADFSNSDYSYSGRLISKRKLVSKEDAQDIASILKGEKGTINSIIKEFKSVGPDPLFNLNDLICTVNRRFGYAADETYDIAQRLYEVHKLISYSRTDCRFIKSTMVDDIKMTINCIKIGKFCTKVHDIKDSERFIERCVNDEQVIEHTAIIPLCHEKLVEVYSSLNEKERNIYDEIVNNFASNFLENHEYERIQVETDVKDYKFLTEGKKIINNGWKSKDYSNEKVFDLMKEKDTVDLIDMQIETVVSKAPSRYTDDTLFRVLENPGMLVDDKTLKNVIKKYGIGTNATRALLVRDLVNNGYVIRDGRYLVPTIDGQNLIKELKTDRLKKPVFTAEIESKLQQIQEGSLDKDILIKEIYKFIEDHVNELKLNNTPIKKNKVIGECPICKKGKVVPAGSKGYGCTELKTTGCKFFISNEILGAKITDEQVYKLITEGKTGALSFVGEKGPFRARIKIEGKRTKFESCKGE